MQEDKREIKKNSSFGVIRSSSYLPEDFDLKSEIDTYRFWLMCRLRFSYAEIFQRRHNLYLENLKKELLATHPDHRIADRTINRIVTQAYNTIPGEFWTNLEKKISLPESKTKIPPRISKSKTQKESYMIDDQSYNSYKNKKNSKKK